MTTNAVARLSVPDRGANRSDAHYLRLGSYCAADEGAGRTVTPAGRTYADGIVLKTDGSLILAAGGSAYVDVASDSDRRIAGDYHCVVQGAEGLAAKAVSINATTAAPEIPANGDIRIAADGGVTMTSKVIKMGVSMTVIDAQFGTYFQGKIDNMAFQARVQMFPIFIGASFAWKTGFTMFAWEVTFGTRWEPRVLDWRIAIDYVSMAGFKANVIPGIKKDIYLNTSRAEAAAAKASPIALDYDATELQTAIGIIEMADIFGQTGGKGAEPNGVVAVSARNKSD